MSYKKTEDLFSREYLCDSKHKLNTSPKAIPVAILNEIENEGMTLESMETLSKKGYDIYKYTTQITLHGVCKELEKDGRIGGYKCLTLNKNKSIGIKWIAIDRAKKERICTMLKECGWGCVNTSTSFYPTRIKRVNNKEEAIAVASEWKKDIDRIDHSLFYGTSDIFLAKGIWGEVYVVCNLVVNGIRKENVDKLIEQASGLPIAEIEAKRSARLEEQRLRHEAWEREYQERRAKEKAEAEIANATFYNDLKSDGYVEAVSNEVPVNTIILIVKKDYDGKLKRTFFRIEKRTAKPCKEDGRSEWGDNRQKLIQKPYKCYVKAS